MSETQDDPNNARYPESTFEAEYPYNQSTITRGGHEIHINDTPGKESLRIAHTIGTYAEIDRNGRTVVTSANGAYFYMKNGMTTTIDGHNDLKISGVQNINVDGSVNDETAGNRYVNTGKDLVVGVGGSLSQHTLNDKYESVGGNESSAVSGGEYRSIDGESVHIVGGVKSDTYNSDWAVTTGGNIEILTDGSMRIRCKNFIIEAESITLKTRAGDVVIDSSSQLLTTSSGQTKVVGNPINLNP